MKIFNRKGTEKPIEIFVALFIILAVALVMLKLFQSQIADKTKELADLQQAQKASELRNQVEQACKDKCVAAFNNGCSDASIASLCAYSSHNVLEENSFVDLNNDKQKDMDTTLLAGIGVCEDRIYCFHLVGSCCGQVINAQTCSKKLVDYWDSKGLVDKTNAQAVKDILTKNVPATDDPSSCPAIDPKTGAKRWDQVENWYPTT